MPMMSHLAEFRNRLIKAAVAVAIGTVLAFAVNEKLLDFLIRPYRVAIPGGSLAYFRPTEAFSTVMRVSLFGGIILASPVILYQIWRFVAPALTPREKRWSYPLIGVFVVLFILGCVTGYLALERGLVFLLEFGGDALEPVIGAEDYLRFATRFILAFGIAFEFPVFLFAAAAFGIVSSRMLGSNRRWAIIIILVFAAIITPSGDPLTLLMLAVPLYVFYELTILAIKLFLRR
jgi:sec-independent protein translocase protein TatC